MRDRLIELISQVQYMGGLEGKLADHLLANGVIVPPCKVGDTVYVLSQGAGFSVVWRVYKATAKAIYFDKYGKLFVYAEIDKDVGGYFEVELIFLTREEAEKALAERREG